MTSRVRAEGVKCQLWCLIKTVYNSKIKITNKKNKNRKFAIMNAQTVKALLKTTPRELNKHLKEQHSVR